MGGGGEKKEKVELSGNIFGGIFLEFEKDLFFLVARLLPNLQGSGGQGEMQQCLGR